VTLWTIEYEGSVFERFFLSLPDYEQVVLSAAITNVLEVDGIGICSSDWGKQLGDGLVEFRVRKSLRSILAVAGEEVPTSVVGADRPVLLRVFCAFHGSKIVLLYSGYNKKKDSSDKRQQREIRIARKIHLKWKRDLRSALT